MVQTPTTAGTPMPGKSIARETTEFSRVRPLLRSSLLSSVHSKRGTPEPGFLRERSLQPGGGRGRTYA